MESTSTPFSARIASTTRSRKRYSAHVFYLVILAVFALALGSHLLPRTRDQAYTSQSSIGRRSTSPLDTISQTLENPSTECRSVHHAKDECAFVRQNCQDEDIGLIPYLDFYYCRLGKTKPLGFTLLSLWLGMLFSTVGIAASDFLCVNLSTIASILGMSESLTGVTFLAFGNGSPDVFSTFAAMSSNSGSLAIGELIGAAGFITAVVAGSMAIARPFRVARRSFVRDILFFALATAFSMIFVADGKLQTWECLTMIGFYIFYVITVVAWHWYVGRQRRKLERDLAARAHFHIPQNQELEIDEVPEDDDPIAGGEQRPLLGATNDDFGTLERGGIPTLRIEEEEEDQDEEDRERQQLAELHDNMRLSRPQTSQRMLSSGAIRPSLVGALEFRSVLSSLRKSRSLQSGRIHLRSYSDDPYSAADSQPIRPRASTTQRPQCFSYHEDGRAVSAAPSIISRPQILTHRPSDEPVVRAEQAADLLCASPTSSGFPSRPQSPAPSVDRSKSPSRLAPPRTVFQQPTYDSGAPTPSIQSSISPGTTPKTQNGASTPDSSGSITPFPPYADESIYGHASVSSPRYQRSGHSIRSGSIRRQTSDIDTKAKGPKWWPGSVLPIPSVLASALFPTLYGWSDKSRSEKLLGIAAAPSVFVLTITLPVVETETSEPDAIAYIEQNLPAAAIQQRPDSSGPGNGLVPSIALPHYHDDERPETDTETLVRPTINRIRQDSEMPVHPPCMESNGKDTPPKGWNRWLILLQLYTAPFFITLTLWSNIQPEHDPRTLILPTLISLLVSCIFAIILLLTTKKCPNKLPKPLRPFVALLGFAVAIAWVSTLATEVVALLKLFGVILNISDSLLGLTIFAVGNSLGDLVANVTIARLGYPVMALSACFGGPMLNILIGIGVGGLYMTLQPLQRLDSSRAISSISPNLMKPYPIVISRTLIISAATLMIILVGLLIAVPLNKWRMDRNIGLGLLAIWSVSTVINVVVELVS